MEGVGWGREIIYLSLLCHHQNDFCIKVGSDECHFNVSVGSDGQKKITKERKCITNTILSHMEVTFKYLKVNALIKKRIFDSLVSSLQTDGNCVHGNHLAGYPR